MITRRLTVKKHTEEIAALKAWIKALDKGVAERKAQRKAENAEYKYLPVNNNNTKEVLPSGAKRRLDVKRVGVYGVLPQELHKQGNQAHGNRKSVDPWS